MEASPNHLNLPGHLIFNLLIVNDLIVCTQFTDSTIAAIAEPAADEGDAKEDAVAIEESTETATSPESVQEESDAEEPKSEADDIAAAAEKAAAEKAAAEKAAAEKAAAEKAAAEKAAAEKAAAEKAAAEEAAR